MTFMITKERPVVILGAGLSGIQAGALLAARQIPFRILEARERIGGRILGQHVPDYPELGVFDVGPTWFWPHSEPYITELAKELGLDTFPQFRTGHMVLERAINQPPQRHMLPELGMELSMRFAGGVETLTNALAARLPKGTISLQHRVQTIARDIEGFSLEVQGLEVPIQAGAVMIALPPRVAARSISFFPALPARLEKDLMAKPTWMAGQAKVVAVYKTPFWREQGLSGLATSWVGPLQEIHDASSPEGTGALFGFFGISAQERAKAGKEQVLEAVQQQLIRLFGPLAQHPIALLYQDWSLENETASLEDAEPLRDYPMYGPINHTEFEESPIVFTGTETDQNYGGHLEGALRSAEQAVAHLLTKIKDS
ncbi:flavin monoamine oxidase family protein [Paenibacillus sp. WLX2291]|uniref:flavin monoamine oxidase family protein n=1 Tax=Paenibacillus sp. WLX2291 TaxID=3296934 RepID=UPI0039840584